MGDVPAKAAGGDIRRRFRLHHQAAPGSAVQGGIKLYAPNRYIRDEVKREYLPLIIELLAEFGGSHLVQGLQVEVGEPSEPKPKGPKASIQGEAAERGRNGRRAGLDPAYTFDSFVEGESNSFAKVAAQQVADNPGRNNNPLLLHGSVGLGKTHLMHAIGNLIHSRDAEQRIVYCHCQVFLESMVEAVRLGTAPCSSLPGATSPLAYCSLTTFSSSPTRPKPKGIS